MLVLHGDTSVNQMPLGVRSDPAAAENGDIVTLPKRPQDDEDVPVMEWWDVPFLPKEKRTDATQHRWEDVKTIKTSSSEGVMIREVILWRPTGQNKEKKRGFHN